jgi:hypothetical protein
MTRVCGVLKEAVGNSDCMKSTNLVAVNNEMERMRARSGICVI